MIIKIVKLCALSISAKQGGTNFMKKRVFFICLNTFKKVPTLVQITIKYKPLTL